MLARIGVVSGNLLKRRGGLMEIMKREAGDGKGDDRNGNYRLINANRSTDQCRFSNGQ